MSSAKQHAEWLSLVEVSGPFLTLSVLNQSHSFGLDAHDAGTYRSVKEAYEEWEDSHAPHIHTAWIRFLLTTILGYPNDCLGEAQSIPESAVANLEIQGERIRPDLAILDPEDPRKVKLPILTYPRTQKLDAPVAGSSWSASPHSRMQLLLQNTGLQAGFVTNGAQWSLVHVRKGEPTGFATWQTILLTEEKLLLQAFKGILGVEATLGAPEDKSLFDLLDQSAQDQEEVTKELGRQVRQAVEVFINAVDRLDQDSGRTLLADLEPKEVYNGALTVMMRLIFLLCAEERGLMDDRALYVQNYSVGDLNDQLREIASGDEQVLEHRHDAWKRLLATFRLVHGGCNHEDLNLPAYGGSLFDPAKYPYLEQCQIDNRVTLHLLDALEFLEIKVPGGGRETRRLSFRALGVEQIGHVYEGLLDHTALRAEEAVAGLTGKETEEDEIALSKLEANKDQIAKFFEKEKIKVSGNAEKLLQQAPNVLKVSKLRVACGMDDALYQRALPFLNIIREDSLEHIQVYPAGSIYVTAGADRRSSGTHYTPVSLTEEVVQYALEPQVYLGPAEGLPRSEWKLKTAKEIVDLKVCDMAMGSGAFLVQACRYLSERLVEAWGLSAEKAQRPIGFSAEGHFFTKWMEGDHHAKTPGTLIETPFGNLAVADLSSELISDNPEERLAQARRIVADRCLYGVDINPMAVEMAKLSLWLTTMRRDRPFTFLDHALKVGDSLFGVTQAQLENYSMQPQGQRKDLFLPWISERIKQSSELRTQLSRIPSHDPESTIQKARVYSQSEACIDEVKAAADLLLAEASYSSQVAMIAPDGAKSIGGIEGQALSPEGRHLVREFVAEVLDTIKFYGKHLPFHWHLEFPEVMAYGGFDAIVGNPPFQGGKTIANQLGQEYHKAICAMQSGMKGTADLVTHFIRRAATLVNDEGRLGLIAAVTVSQTDNREACLDILLASNWSIYRATSQIKWPGNAQVSVTLLWLGRTRSKEERRLNGVVVEFIPGSLNADLDVTQAMKLKNGVVSSAGIQLYGKGFVLEPDAIERACSRNPGLKEYLRNYVNGDVLNESPIGDMGIKVADFGELEQSQIVGCAEFLENLIPTVTAERANQTRQIHENRPWLHWDKRTKFMLEARKQGRILACSTVSRRLLFDFIESDALPVHRLTLFLDRSGLFAVLQSCFHEWWTRAITFAFGRSTISYSTSDVLSTYPFPAEMEPLGSDAAHFFERRRELRALFGLGLNGLYDLVDEPSCKDARIQEFRKEIALLDEAVRQNYGWSDLSLGHDFHGEGSDLRFTISPVARQEILRRLLKLNHERYAEEVKAGLHDKSKLKAAKSGKSARTANPSSSLAPRASLFDDQMVLGEEE